MSRSLLAILAALVTVGGLAAVVVVAGLIRRIAPSRTTPLACCFLVAYSATLLLRPSWWPVIDLAVLLGAVGGVLILERGLRTLGAVAAFLAVAATVDVLSVSGGLSHLVIDRYRQGTSDLLLYLTLVIPVHGRIIPIVGIGDLLVGGAAARAFLRLGLRPFAVISTFAIGLLTALAYGLWRGGAPAVPFLAGAAFFLVWAHSIPSSTRRRSGPATSYR